MTKAWANWKPAEAPPEEPMKRYAVRLVKVYGQSYQWVTVRAPDRERAEEWALMQNPAWQLSAEQPGDE